MTFIIFDAPNRDDRRPAANAIAASICRGIDRRRLLPSQHSATDRS